MLFKIISRKNKKHFTNDWTLTLHEDFESITVFHGKPKQWLKYYTIRFQTAHVAEKPKAQTNWCFCGLNWNVNKQTNPFAVTKKKVTYKGTSQVLLDQLFITQCLRSHYHARNQLWSYIMCADFLLRRHENIMKYWLQFLSLNQTARKQQYNKKMRTLLFQLRQ